MKNEKCPKPRHLRSPVIVGGDLPDAPRSPIRHRSSQSLRLCLAANPPPFTQGRHGRRNASPTTVPPFFRLRRGGVAKRRERVRKQHGALFSRERDRAAARTPPPAVPPCTTIIRNQKAEHPRGYPAFCMLWFTFSAYSSPARVILSEAYAESNCEAAPSNATAESRADRSFFTMQRCCRPRRNARNCPRLSALPRCNNTAWHR